MLNGVNMNKKLIGKRVSITKTYAKWLLDHLDWCHTAAGKLDPAYIEDVELCFFTALDSPIIGRITGFGIDCYRVEFKTSSGKNYAYYDRKNLVVYE